MPPCPSWTASPPRRPARRRDAARRHHGDRGLNDSWGTGDNPLWLAILLLTPVALVLASVTLSRGHRRRWLVAALLFVAVVALTAALGLLAQALVDAFYDGDNLGLLWEAPNWVSALVFLALGLLVLRRGQSRSRPQEPVRTIPAS